MKRRVVITDELTPLCNKIAFSSRAEAATCLRRSSMPGGGMHVYKCPRCGAWHLGHKHKKQAA